MSLLQLPASRPIAACLGALFVGLAATTANAAGTPCHVSVMPSGNPAWEQAARDVEAKLAARSRPGDCGSAVVEVQGGGARLVFTTSDGRRAVRQLARPAELAPTLEALLVTGSIATPEEPGAHPAPLPTPIRDRAPARPAPSHVAPAQHAAVHFGASAGARVGTHSLVTPVLDAFGSLSLERWELGVFGQWEMGYHELVNEADPRQRSSGLAAGISVGRREPLGGSVSLLGGAQLGLAALDEEVVEHNPTQSRAEGRLGAYVGAVVPRRGETHFRAELVGEIVPNHIGQTPESSTGQPLMPWWATTLTVGVELGRP